MKTGKLVFMFVLMFAASLIVTQAYAQMGPGMMGPGPRWGQGYGPPQQGGWYCPYCGSWHGEGWGGMMGRGMGPGMMGPGYGPGYGYGSQYQQPQKPLDKDQAEKLMENYLHSMRNPNLKLGNIEGKDGGYEAEIVTKDGSLVDKVFVDKDTGWMRSIC
jgi:hypothetical protein